MLRRSKQTDIGYIPFLHHSSRQTPGLILTPSPRPWARIGTAAGLVYAKREGRWLPWLRCYEPAIRRRGTTTPMQKSAAW
ncbi:hypothetical protein V495_00725 [Pseudogymnoascus sp. VKM F-4514 (FW-929)]|nr:hypothetical protein V490_04955 [Pseudogymnoascus sp. VKM F-3557]KFY49137.1 hypothetical protein V495_00725 [Pseudogymnoascus sp. VKM F-4514 (FW-929)]KFY65798.1 hypothetical protein V497_01302 [Pseudogymnoascus sp. VKM F-4516 (FW-969)]